MSTGNDPVSALLEISSATISTVLLKKGLRNVWMRGCRPLRPGQSRIAGPAFTLRFIPAREDLATPAAWASPRSTRAAIEEMPPGAVAVADTAGITDAGIFGDILCERMQRRGVTGLVTSGVVRDGAGVLATGLPVWSSGLAAPPSLASLTFAGWQEPIGSGGVAVLPGDMVVADGDGVVVIPAALLEEVVDASVEQERLEAWIMTRVQRGEALPGLYPPNERNWRRYREECLRTGKYGVDYAFLSELEGGCRTTGYVPAAGVSRSGVTIATGFDLGQREEADLLRLDFPAPLIARLAPYLGKQGRKAQQFLQRNPLEISEEEARQIDAAVINDHLERLRERYVSAPDNAQRVPFTRLPPAAQTVIASVSFQYGLALDRRTPRFWRAATAQDWDAAVAELEDFGDDYPTRRQREAALLKQVLV